jgi:hypothetical protein
VPYNSQTDGIEFMTRVQRDLNRDGMDNIESAIVTSPPVYNYNSAMIMITDQRSYERAVHSL